MPASADLKRALTDGEQFILSQIQDIYGPQNTLEDVFFRPRGDAVIFAKDRSNAQVLGVVLTNLAKWYADGTIASLDELRKNWLHGDV